MLSFKQKQSGFTLMEVVIALALGGLILSSVMALFVGFVQAFENRNTSYDKFLSHVDHCIRFLTQRAQSIESIMTTESKQNSEFYKIIKVDPAKIKLNTKYVFGMLQTKSLPFLSPLIHQPTWELWVLTPHGLSFLLEAPAFRNKRFSEGVEKENKTELKYFLLSPYVIKLEYAHLDTSKKLWEFFPSLERYVTRFGENTSILHPDGIRITFKKEDWEEVRFLPLNTAAICEVKKDSNSSQKHEKNK